MKLAVSPDAGAIFNGCGVRRTLRLLFQKIEHALRLRPVRIGRIQALELERFFPG